MKTTNTPPQIVLDEAALHRASRNQPAIMPLGSPLAAASTEWHATVYWVSTSHPERLLGRLLEQYHGIYPVGPHTLRVQLGDDVTDHCLPSSLATGEPANLQQLMAKVLQSHLQGISTAHIQSHLNQSIPNHQPIREAA